MRARARPRAPPNPRPRLRSKALSIPCRARIVSQIPPHLILAFPEGCDGSLRPDRRADRGRFVSRTETDGRQPLARSARRKVVRIPRRLTDTRHTSSWMPTNRSTERCPDLRASAGRFVIELDCNLIGSRVAHPRSVTPALLKTEARLRTGRRGKEYAPSSLPVEKEIGAAPTARVCPLEPLRSSGAIARWSSSRPLRFHLI